MQLISEKSNPQEKAWIVRPIQGQQGTWTVVAPSGHSYSVTRRMVAWGVVWSCTNSAYIQQPDNGAEFISGDTTPIMAVLLYEVEKHLQNEAPARTVPITPPVDSMEVAQMFGAGLVRRDFCSVYPLRRAEYIEAQREMFKAARDAGLDANDRDGMIEAINNLLATHKQVCRITSRKQLTPKEMRYLALAFSAGAVRAGWEIEDPSMLEI